MNVLWRRAALLCATLILSLGVGECAARLIPESVLGFHYTNGRFGLPREFQMNKSPNSLGFHDVEPRPRDRDVQRVLLLGDSYVESYSVTATLIVGQRLQHHLNKISETRHEVVSIGKSGWGQIDELEALHRYGEQIAPDLVLTLFLPLNDVENNSDALRQKTRMQHLNPELMFRPGWTHRAAAGMPLLFVEHSVLNQLISHRLAWGMLRRPPEGSASIPIDYFIYRDPVDEEWKAAWRDTERLVADTRELAAKLGAAYALASASSPQGVLGAESGREVLLNSYPAMREFEWDLDMPDRQMAELCARLDIPYLALEPMFREATASGSVLHWRFDGHWNAEGNDLAGRRLAEFIMGLTAASRH
jgi:hypothetical protein